jgi:SAM-dependent methyltransferase
VDFSNPRQRAAFFEIHRDLPREGPGNRGSTLKALSLARKLPDRPRVLDIGCGPGAQTLDLANAMPQATIVAVDTHRPFLEDLRRRAAAVDFADRIWAVEANMARLDFPPASFDLIWCEGAVYFMGLSAALLAWRRLLRPGGKIAITEPVWLKPDPPKPALANWAGYPTMRRVGMERPIFLEAGYRLMGAFTLPEAAWWDDYYRPMQKRLEDLADRFLDDPEAEIVLLEAQDEIECYRRYSTYFGYCFYVATI